MEIKNLENIPLELIHEAFILAFSEYEVQIDMPFERFTSTILAKNFTSNYSVGCFDKNRLVSFALIGFRENGLVKNIYDVATGVIPEYQGKGLGNRMIQEVICIAKANNIDDFYLEVLMNNKPAIALYRKFGFEVTRELLCYEMKEIEKVKNDKYNTNNDYHDLEQLNEKEYLSFEPTWQNSFITYQNSLEQHSLINVSDSNTFIGYGIINKQYGCVLQLGINPKYRNREIEDHIIGLMANETSSEKLKFINIEKNSYLSHELERIGFLNTVNQFEMKVKIRN